MSIIRYGRRNVGRGLLLVAILGLMTVQLAACHTVQGAGDDIKAIGEAGQDAIDDAGAN